MSAAVCGKRSLFEDIYPSPPITKRVRCGGSPIFFTPPAAPAFRSPATGTEGWGSSQGAQQSSQDIAEDLLKLRSLFPGMEEQVLADTLSDCGNDLNSAIRSLNQLRLSAANAPERVVSPGVSSPPVTSPDGSHASAQVQHGGALSLDPSTQPQQQPQMQPQPQLQAALGVDSPPPPSEGMEWVEQVVREMMSAADLADARARAARVLEGFERVVLVRGAAVATALEKENLSLKETIQNLLKDNHILKRAVAIQHERQQELEQKGHEAVQLKELLSQYQEQMRKLELNNYTLTMHLKTAQETSSIPGRFHPDIF